MIWALFMLCVSTQQTNSYSIDFATEALCIDAQPKIKTLYGYDVCRTVCVRKK